MGHQSVCLLIRSKEKAILGGHCPLYSNALGLSLETLKESYGEQRNIAGREQLTSARVLKAVSQN